MSSPQWIETQGERAAVPAGIANLLLFFWNLQEPLFATLFLTLAVLSLSALSSYPHPIILRFHRSIPILFWIVLSATTVLMYIWYIAA